ncbi:hypothetical protein [Trichlorobacter lovleyi]|nr:hypothetical protein [Trichlorobacter lovleyi]
MTSGLMPVIRDNRLSSVLDDCSVFDYEQAMRKNNQQTVAAVVVVTL